MKTVPEWELVPGGWRYSDPRARGWQHDSVVEVMRYHWPRWSAIVGSTAPLGIMPLAPHGGIGLGHNLSMTFGYVLARAAYGKTQMAVLDWGGALGHYALMAHALMPELPIDVTVKEIPGLARAGRALQRGVSFVDNDAEAFSRQYDLVIASGSLQYAENWRDISGRLAEASTQWLFVTRLPLVRRSASFVTVQRPQAVGFQTEYISWVLNRDEFLAHMASLGATVEREFLVGEATQHAGATEVSESLGFLFRQTRG
jgi:putative methyltransferase (TIGR04325 family)